MGKIHSRPCMGSAVPAAFGCQSTEMEPRRLAAELCASPWDQLGGNEAGLLHGTVGAASQLDNELCSGELQASVINVFHQLADRVDQRSG
jgi:hypothetical protein